MRVFNRKVMEERQQRNQELVRQHDENADLSLLSALRTCGDSYNELPRFHFGALLANATRESGNGVWIEKRAGSYAANAMGLHGVSTMPSEGLEPPTV